jgi:hypothetical protein
MPWLPASPWIGSEIDFRALETRVTEPEGDLPNVAGRVQSVHGTRMPQTVRRNLFLRQRRLPGAGSSNVLFQNVFETRPSHDIAAGVQEEGCALRLTTNLKPVTKSGRCLFPQRKHPFTTAFAHHVNGGLRVEDQISQIKTDQL